MPGPVDPSETSPDPRPFRRSLQRWFRRRGRDLPWRRTRDPYAILVSEIMLQQTQVATVIPYYERWLARFPDFAALARAKESEVLHAWQGLGYYARARHLHAAAKFVRQNFRGQLPRAAAEIARLPGVGRYTAGAIASFAFDLPAPVVEANIARVLARLTNWQAPIDSSAGQAHLWQTAASLLPRRGAREHNSALMDLGALVCVPRQPRCGKCPVRRFCQAEQPDLLPVKRKRPRTVALFEPHAFTRRSNRILLEQSSDRWRGMWILPRLARLPKEDPLLKIDFTFTHHRVTLAVFDGPQTYQPNKKQRWFPRQALARLPLPSPHRRALALLLADAGPANSSPN
ncbi:MAG: A/G-specific adenine glycosylase [Chthoniobacterales bacterium]|nr:A/G-specific adenine glycosylase [Chthoniobacterales bacterium]